MSITESQAIEQFVPHLRRFARALLDDVDQADSLVRDCLDEAILRRRRNEMVTNLRVWLFTILHRQYVRLSMRNGGSEAEPASWKSRQFTGDRREAADAAGFTVRDFENAFRQLPAEDQQILLLIGLECMSHQETAEVLGMPLGTLMLRLWQIKKRLHSIELRTSGQQTSTVRPLLRSHILNPSARTRPAESRQRPAAVVRLARH